MLCAKMSPPAVAKDVMLAKSSAKNLTKLNTDAYINKKSPSFESLF
jgi:hypothetical protein